MMLPSRSMAQGTTRIDAGARRIGIGLFMLILGLGALQVRAQSASLRGFVTAASDGEALQGVNVALDNLSGLLNGVASNGDGFFLITRVSPGRYQLRASFIGFATYVDTLDIEADDRLLVNIVLRDDVDQQPGGARCRGGRNLPRCAASSRQRRTGRRCKASTWRSTI